MKYINNIDKKDSGFECYYVNKAYSAFWFVLKGLLCIDYIKKLA